jgi:hypothetical protein
MRPLVACLLLFLAMPARADEIVLRGGRSLMGEIVARTATSVTIEIGPGRVTLPLTAVDRVVSGPSALATYRDRAQRLSSEDAAGWLALGLWARDHGLATQAATAFERAIAIDPSNEQAQQALGRVRVADRWMTRDDAYRAQGIVQFQGDWLTPQEREARLAQQQIEADIERQRVESEARLREAEARARAAEAEARRAEAEAASQTSVPVVPFGIGFPRRRFHDNDDRPRHPHDHGSTPAPQATPVPHRVTVPKAQPAATPPMPSSAGIRPNTSPN